MQIILSSNCIALTGMLDHSLGYHIEQRKNGFFAKRNQRGDTSVVIQTKTIETYDATKKL